MVYSSNTVEIIRSDSFDAWLDALRDSRARAKINVRIRRLSLGNPGDRKRLGGGLCELRIDYGPGYRVYYVQHSPRVAVVLVGGDKRSQRADIERAREIADDWSHTHG